MSREASQEHFEVFKAFNREKKGAKPEKYFGKTKVQSNKVSNRLYSEARTKAILRKKKETKEESLLFTPELNKKTNSIMKGIIKKAIDLT